MLTPLSNRLRIGFWLAVFGNGLLMGCTPEIGDECAISTDCSIRGERLCDTSQPGGYCTQLNCLKNTCPDDALCVLFDSAIPGCGFNDRAGPYGSRVARSFCVAQCSGSGSDCRDGYVCAHPQAAPWQGLVLDDRDDAQRKRGCLVRPPKFAQKEPNQSEQPDAGVCHPTSPPVADIDASAPNIEAPVTDAGVPSDAASDGG